MNIIRYGGPMSRTRKVGSPIGYSSAGLTGFVSVWATTAINETITIPTQNDTFNAVVDWGDGTVETITTYNGFSHVYDDIGDHTISITGTFPNIYMQGAASATKLKKVLNLGTVGWTSLQSAFRSCSNLTDFTSGSTDTSAVSITNAMFYQCFSLNSLDVSSFDTSSVATMSYMFRGCAALTRVDVTSFDTSSVATMFGMFYLCNALTSIVGAEDFIITGLDSTEDLTYFLTGGKMTRRQYDALLVKWQAQVQVTPSIPAMTASFGASIHSPEPSRGYTAKVLLVAFFSWTISDGVTP